MGSPGAQANNHDAYFVCCFDSDLLTPNMYKYVDLLWNFKYL